MTGDLATQTLALQDLVASYAVLLDAREMDAFAELWEPDATMRFGRTCWEGRAGIVAGAGSSPIGVHLGAIPVLAIDGRHATGRQNFVFVDATDRSVTMGRYEDTYACTDGRWRFVSRTIAFIRPAPAS